MGDKLTRKLYSYARFSSAGQKEESIERQQRAAWEYAKSFGEYTQIEFIEADKGVSAFKGKNLVKGALGDFISKLNTGELKGTEVRLVIENIDSFSRAQTKKAYERFVELLDGYDIEVFVTSENALYTKESDTMAKTSIS